MEDGVAGAGGFGANSAKLPRAKPLNLRGGPLAHPGLILAPLACLAPAQATWCTTAPLYSGPLVGDCNETDGLCGGRGVEAEVEVDVEEEEEEAEEEEEKCPWWVVDPRCFRSVVVSASA